MPGPFLGPSRPAPRSSGIQGNGNLLVCLNGFPPPALLKGPHVVHSLNFP